MKLLAPSGLFRIKYLSIIILVIFLQKNVCAQYVPPAPVNNTVTYLISRNFGDENLLKYAGNISATFVFDSIGKNWNMPTENDYMRFKILHFYILNERKEGEHWKKMYRIEKNDLLNTFDRYMTGRLKNKEFKISTEFSSTNYVLQVFFIDKAVNVQHDEPIAICRFVDSRTNTIVLQYTIQPKNKNETGTFPDLVVAFSNYLKKHA